MPKNNLNVTLKGLDELLFSTEEQRQEEKREQVQQIPIDELYPFTNHPFKVLEDDSMAQTVKSIKEYGILSPLIARPRPDGDGYIRRPQQMQLFDMHNSPFYDPNQAGLL